MFNSHSYQRLDQQSPTVLKEVAGDILKDFISTSFDYIVGNFRMDNSSVSDDVYREVEQLKQQLTAVLNTLPVSASPLTRVVSAFSNCKLTLDLLDVDTEISRTGSNPLLLKMPQELCRLFDVSYQSLLIDFSEVFYVDESGKIPLAFRPGKDRLVHDKSTYLKLTSRFSYVLGQRLLTKDSTIYHMSSNCKETILNYDLNTLKPCEHIAVLPVGNRAHYNLICVNATMLIVENVYQLLSNYKSRNDLIVVIKDTAYQSLTERERVRDAFKKAIQDAHFAMPIHLIFLTHIDQVAELTLKQCLSVDLTDAFSALPNHLGYICTDKQLVCNIQRLEKMGKSSPFSAQSLFLPENKQDEYIIRAPEAGLPSDYRAYKQQSAQQLKSNVTLSTSYQLTEVQQAEQSHAHSHEIQQTQMVNQQTTTTAEIKESHSSGFSFDEPGMNLSQFTNVLNQYARGCLDKFDVVCPKGLTQHGVARRKKILERLVNDTSFRYQLAAGVMGHHIDMQHPNEYTSRKISLVDEIELRTLPFITLPPFAILHDNIDIDIDPSKYGEFLIWVINQLDGINFSQSGVLVRKTYLSSTYHFCHLPYHFVKVENYDSQLPSISDDYYPFQQILLLHCPEFYQLTQEAQDAWWHKSALMIAHYKHKRVHIDTETRASLKQYTLELIQLYYHESEKREAYSAVLGKLTDYFALYQSDSWNILFHLFLKSRSPQLDQFFDLLVKLDHENQLKDFYHLHFLYKDKYNDDELPFDNLLSRRLFLVDYKHHQLFVDFFKHALLFILQNGGTVDDLGCSRAIMFWQQIRDCFLTYSDGIESKANALLQTFVNQLVSPEKGLCLAPLSCPETLFNGLGDVLTHATQQGMLEEQLNQLKGISLKWLDSLYAIHHNQFYVVSQEMQLNLSQPSCGVYETNQKPSYRVSREVLTHLLCEHPERHADIKVAFFRYLGGIKLRESLTFYQHLWEKAVTGASASDSRQVSLNIMVLVHSVLMTTDKAYGQLLSAETLSAQLGVLDFEVAGDALNSAIERCMTHHHALLSVEKQDNTCLWRLCDMGRLNLGFGDKLPELLTKRFARDQFLRFINMHKQELKSLRHLFDADNDDFRLFFLKQVVAAIFQKLPHQSFPLLFINRLYQLQPRVKTSDSQPGFVQRWFYRKDTPVTPVCLFSQILDELPVIERILHAYAAPLNGESGKAFYEASCQLLRISHQIDIIANVFECINQCSSADRDNVLELEARTRFLKALMLHPLLVLSIARSAPLIRLVLSAYFKAPQSDFPLALALSLAESVHQWGSADAHQTMQQVLDVLTTTEGQALLREHDLNGAKLKFIGQCYMRYGMPIEFIRYGLKEGGFSPQVERQLETMSPDALKCISQLCAFEGKTQHFDVYLDIAHEDLVNLSRLVQHKNMTAAQLKTLRQQRPLKDAIQAFEKQCYITNLGRFDVHPHAKTAIKTIACLSPNLTCVIQESIFDDYETVLQLAKAIHTYDQHELSRLLTPLRQAIVASGDKQSYLMLLAIACEAMYRMTTCFPRYTQIAPVLLSFIHQGGLIQEIKTGEGKSITTALQAAVFHAEGYDEVHIATENVALAHTHLVEFKSYYAYLGIKLADELLDVRRDVQSAHQRQQVYCSTLADIALWRAKMRKEKKQLPNRVAWVCDEIDANLMQTLQFRLAESIDPIFRDSKIWQSIYSSMLAFVRDEALFLNNACSSDEDVQNFKRFYQRKHVSDSSMLQSFSKIPDAYFNELINAAVIEEALREEVDFLCVDDPKQKNYKVAAPILSETKRPAPHVNYSHAIQQLLHTRLNAERPMCSPRFNVEQQSEPILIKSAKNVFDAARLRQDRVIGFTGTAGSDIEIKEFYEHNGFTVFRYPTFYQSRCEMLPDMLVQHGDQLFNTLFDFVSNRRLTSTRPILIFVGSPKDARLLERFFFQQASSWLVSYYAGYEPTQGHELSVIQHAGEAHRITITTESLARGANFSTSHPDGYLVINTCTDLTETEYQQMVGRSARNGHQGTFCSIVPSTRLSGDFAAHRRMMSLKKQEVRLKTRLLEDIRDHLVEYGFLDLRDTMDAIVQRQYGHQTTFVDAQGFARSLHQFNLQLEKQYHAILQDKVSLTSEERAHFLQSASVIYNDVLKTMLPEQKMAEYRVVEPLVRFEHLAELAPYHSMTLQEFAVISPLLSSVWRYWGNQKMQMILPKADCMSHALHQAMTHQQYDKVINTSIESFLQWQQLTNDDVLQLVGHLETLANTCLDELKNLSIIGRFIPVTAIKTTFANYFAQTKTLIRNNQWHQLSLPLFDLQQVNAWYERIKTIGSMINVAGEVSSIIAGPVPFIANYIVMPILRKCLGQYLSSYLQQNKKESGMVSICAGVTEVLNSKALSSIVGVLFDSSLREQTSLANVLTMLSPIFENSAVRYLIEQGKSKSGDNAVEGKTGWEQMDALLQCYTDLKTILHAHQDKKLTDLLRSEVLLDLGFNLFQLDSVKRQLQPFNLNIDPLELKNVVDQLTSRSAGLTVTHLFHFIELFAHPELNTFLISSASSGSRVTLGQLKDCLSEGADAGLPEPVKTAFNALMAYQRDARRIEVDTQQQLKQMQDRYRCSVATLEDYLKRLAPKAPEEKPIVIPPVAAPSESDRYYGLISWEMARYLLKITALIVANVIFFSPWVLLVSALGAAKMTYDMVSACMISTPPTSGPRSTTCFSWFDTHQASLPALDFKIGN